VVVNKKRFNKSTKIRLCRSKVKQVTMRRQTLLFVLAIYLDVTAVNSHFDPFMDSEYFSIDWAGRESSRPDDVCNINVCHRHLRTYLFLHDTSPR